MVVEEINLSKRLAPPISREVGQVDMEAGSVVCARGLRTLVYLSTNHYQATENQLLSPLALRKMHRVTAKQFTWVLLRARVEALGDCEMLLVGKGWMGGRSK